tara:strand:+ start:512 stop:790 length:279 start_codon:yes stop_codon:yes gene_type:complete
MTKSWLVKISCECVFINSSDTCGCASADEIRPIENTPANKIASNARFFTSKLSKYYYFKFFKIRDQLMGIISKAMILGGIFVIFYAVFTILE